MIFWANKIAVILGGNRDNGVNAGSRASNWNNYVWNSNWNIGCRFACEDILFKTMHSIIVNALLVRPKKYGQLVCPALANTLKRSAKVRVMKMKLQDSIQKGQ